MTSSPTRNSIARRPGGRPQLLHSTTTPIVTASATLAIEDVYKDASTGSSDVSADLTPLQRLTRRKTEPTSKLSTRKHIKEAAATTNESLALQPSYWTDHTHLGTLLRIWDAMRLVTDTDVTDGRTAAQAKLDATHRRMLRFFGELAHGKIGLSKQWISYVLMQNLRLPQSKIMQASQSRWAVLGSAAAGGLSKGWGPW